MIRAATHDDVPALLVLLREFHAASGMSAVAPFCAESLATSLRGMIGNDAAILLVADVAGQVAGVAGAMLFPAYFNAAVQIGQETFWWASPEHRGTVGPALMDALEAEAKARGAVKFLMVSLEALRPEAVGKLYQRRGYAPLEHSFVRAI